jgi:hypothetical protein
MALPTGRREPATSRPREDVNVEVRVPEPGHARPRRVGVQAREA